MKIRKWHVGKIILLWAWCAVILAVLLEIMRRRRELMTQHLAFGTAVLLLFFALPITLSIITWIWLGAKECEPDDATRLDHDQNDERKLK